MSNDIEHRAFWDGTLVVIHIPYSEPVVYNDGPRPKDWRDDWKWWSLEGYPCSEAQAKAEAKAFGEVKNLWDEICQGERPLTNIQRTLLGENDIDRSNLHIIFNPPPTQ